MTIDVLAHAIAARWPDVEIDRARLAAALVERGVTAASPHARDVGLMDALAAGDRAALEVFERELLPDVRRGLARVADGEDVADEAIQQLRVKLLADSKTPQILGYRAKGSLVAWLQVIAIREALMLKRAAKRESPTEDPLLVVASGDPVLALAKRRHRGQLEVAFRAALTALEPRERALLRLCFVEGVGTEQLATQYRVHRATMFRWLCDARAHLLAELRDRLVTEAGIGESEVDSLARAIASSFDVGWT